MKNHDERDTMFARMNYQEGSKEYDDYYSRNPQLKNIDDSLRSLTPLGGEGSMMYDRINSPMIDAAFNYLSDIRKNSEGKPNSHKTEVDAGQMSEKIKGLARFYNAKIVGITEMKDYHYYSHRGRHIENYGQEITNTHKYGIAFAVPMDRQMIMSAPGLPEAISVVKGYVDAATIGMILAYYIRELGYEARNHMDGNYLLVAPLVARDAGIGEFGRNGLIISREYGACIRLGVVTTDMPLITDEIDDFGVKEFCADCGRCAKTCPGKAINAGDNEQYWKINPESCYKRWRHFGTDCGICIANCPFTYSIDKDKLDLIKCSPQVRKDILDDFNIKYGKRPKTSQNPTWLD